MERKETQKEHELQIEIVQIGQKAVDAYEKGNLADFCYYEKMQQELKEMLEIEKYKQLGLNELIGEW